MLKAKRLLKEAKFDEAVAAARELVQLGDTSGHVIIAIEALTRRSIEEAIEILEFLLSKGHVGPEVTQAYWLASKLTCRTRVMRNALRRLTALGRSCRPAQILLRQIPEAAEQILAVEGVSTQLQFLPGYQLPVVTADCGGLSARLLVDTGANEMYLAKELATKLDLSLIVCSRPGIFAGGQTALLRQGVLPELRLGSIRVMTVPVVVPDVLGQIGESRIDGIIGSQLLSKFLVTLDFRRSVLTLENSRASKREPFVEGRLLASHIFVIPAQLAGEPGIYFIDSGGTFGVAPDVQGWRQLARARNSTTTEGVSAAGHKVSYEVIKNVDLSLAGTAIKGATAVGGIFPAALNSLPTRVNGIISHEILARFDQVTFDLNHRRISFGPLGNNRNCASCSP